MQDKNCSYNFFPVNGSLRWMNWDFGRTNQIKNATHNGRHQSKKKETVEAGKMKNA